MRISKRIAVRLGGVLSIAVLGWVAGTLWHASKTETRLLPKGGRLTLESVVYGKPSKMASDAGWRGRVASSVPELIARKLGFNFISAGGTNELTFWLVGEGLNKTSRLRAVTVDEHGCELGLCDVAQYGYQQPGQTLLACAFSVFPRRAQTVGLRLYEQQTNGTWSVLTEFSTSNPGANQWPEWTAERLPNTKSASGVDFKLLELKSGVRAGSSPPRPMEPGERPGLYLKFRLTENERLTRAWGWGFDGFSISDASGQVIDSGFASGTTRNENQFVVTYGGLCVEEKAWKLKAQFTRVSGFAADELWTVRGVPVPDALSASKVDATTNLHGVQLQLHGVVGRNCPTPKARRMLSGYPLVHLARPNLGANQRLSLARAVDERGREIRNLGSAGENVDFFFSLSLPPGVRSLDLTFAVTRTVEVEYLVKPTRINPAEISKLER